MTKPVIVTRLGKGSELTFSEGDANFTNLRDATINVSGDSGTTQNIELNGSLTVAGGTGLSTATTSGTVTVNLDNTAVTPGSYTNANVTVDAQGRVTSAANGFSGSYNDLTNKPSIPTAVSQLTNDSGYITGINSSAVTTALGFTPENPANKGQANGYAGLDAGGKVPSALLPSYVDDVEEYANLASFPATGESGKIYVALATNKVYRWSGSAYVEISASPGSTDAVTEGSVNLYFTTQRARDSFSAGAGISITDGVIANTRASYTDAQARLAVSVTDAGGDGSLSYENTTGVLTYTGPGASDYRAAFSAGTGITITNGVIASTVNDTNTTYSISAETATGGVNLRLTGSDASTDDVKLAAGSNITLTRTDANTITIAGSAGGLTDIVQDTTPELGGNLDLKDFKIVNSGVTGSIIVEPSNYGNAVYLKTPSIEVGNSTGTTQVSIYPVGTQNLALWSDNQNSSNIILRREGLGGHVDLNPGTSGLVRASKSILVQSAGEVRFGDSDSSNYVGFKAPNTVSADRIWTLPAADGTNGQVLSTNGSGTLSWTAVSGGLPTAYYTTASIVGTDNNTGFEVDSTTAWTSRYNNASITVPTAGQFTLPAGNWMIFWSFNSISASGTGTSTWALKNGSTNIVLFQNSLSSGAYVGQTYNGYVSLGSQTTLQVTTNRSGNTPRTAVENVLMFVKVG